MFCANFCFSLGGYPSCLKVWWRGCYQKEKLDRFHINQPLDKDRNLMYNDEWDQNHYCAGLDDAQSMLPFQCDLCMFHTLFNRDPRDNQADLENLSIICRMNLDLIWSCEPSTIQKNFSYLNQIITPCEASDMSPTLPCPSPCPFEDIHGWLIAFARLFKSSKPGRHSKTHTHTVCKHL